MRQLRFFMLGFSLASAMLGKHTMWWVGMLVYWLILIAASEAYRIGKQEAA